VRHATDGVAKRRIRPAQQPVLDRGIDIGVRRSRPLAAEPGAQSVLSEFE
jgi:hypothetical protein